MNMRIVYDWPGESYVSHNLETGETTIYVASVEPDPAAAVQRCAEEIKRREWD